MNREIKFVEGIRTFKPNTKAPSYVKANLKINRNELMMWLDKQGEEISIDLKESQKGTYYLQVSDFKKDGSVGFSADVRVTADGGSWRKSKEQQVNQYDISINEEDDLPF